MARSARANYFLGVMSRTFRALARFAPHALPIAAVTVLGWSGGVMAAGPAPSVRLVDEVNPLAGKPFYVDPISKAMAAANSASPPSARTAR